MVARMSQKNGLADIANPLEQLGGPKGIRTPVTDVRGQRPRPLDDGTFLQNPIQSNLKLTKKQRQIQAGDNSDSRTIDVRPQTKKQQCGKNTMCFRYRRVWCQRSEVGCLNRSRARGDRSRQFCCKKKEVCGLALDPDDQAYGSFIKS